MANDYSLGVSALCVDEYITNPLTGDDWLKEDAAYWLTTVDGLVIIFYLVMLLILRIGAKNEADDIHRSNVTADDYTIMVEAFPKNMVSVELEIELWEHLEKMLTE